ncbi:GIY-YIG nuclease family protein [Curtobacterium sp. RRHDQ10]|uniref:GIY-YIG nuclease family protein n=1 Tax=Curtobacterium phyllosphaerae TaxID=3413379 RepID=UPI003BF379D3
MTTTACAAERCRGRVPGDAPVPLCAQHLDVARDFADRSLGTPDVLPTPCPLCRSRVGVRYPSAWICAVCEWRYGEVPDAELPPPRVDVVYYIRFDDRIKIGTTANPRQRLARLWHQELLAFERGDRTVERVRHEQFAAFRHPGSEWFAVHAELDAHVELLRAGQPDPWARHARWTSEALALRT